MPAEREPPRYRSYKTVWALKIKNIEPLTTEASATDTDKAAGAMIQSEEDGYAPFYVDGVYMAKHQPKVGGYYVVYSDGYKSWSPADAFEEGYTRE